MSVNYDIKGSKKFVLKTYLDSGYGNKEIKTDSLIKGGTIYTSHKMGYVKTVFIFELSLGGKILQKDSIVLYPISSVKIFSGIKMNFQRNGKDYLSLNSGVNYTYGECNEEIQKVIDMYFCRMCFGSDPNGTIKFVSPSLYNENVKDWTTKNTTSFVILSDLDTNNKTINSLFIKDIYESSNGKSNEVIINKNDIWISFKTHTNKYGLIHITDMSGEEVVLDIIIQK